MPDYNTLTRDIKDGNIKSLYIFHGAEAYLRAHALELLQKALISEGAEDFNLHKLDGKGLTLRTLSDAVEGLPFLSERKLIMVSDFDLYKIPTDARDDWVEFLKDIPKTSTLCFIYQTIPYKPDGRSKIAAALKKLDHQVIEFAEQSESQLTGWINRHFKSRGLAVERSLCEYLIFRCGRNMTALLGEISKISAYCSGGDITREAIDEVTEPILEAISFDLTDAISAGVPAKAIEILQKLQWLREPPEALLGLCGKSIRGLYAARLALDYKKTSKDVMKVCGYASAYPAELLMKAARNRTRAWCEGALLAVREADAMLKGEVPYEREGVMEWLVAKIL